MRKTVYREISAIRENPYSSSIIVRFCFPFWNFCFCSPCAALNVQRWVSWEMHGGASAFNLRMRPEKQRLKIKYLDIRLSHYKHVPPNPSYTTAPPLSIPKNQTIEIRSL